jgi:hypothetical protein
MRVFAKILKILKYLAIGSGALIALLISLGAYDYYFPATYEAAIKLPAPGVRVLMQFQPDQPFLAEYRRFLVLRRPGTEDQRIEMFPDTGGYGRTQVYRLPDGGFLVQGYFDEVKIDPAIRNLAVHYNGPDAGATYIGAFDRSGGEWRFVEAKYSPEQKLVAGGG